MKRNTNQNKLKNTRNLLIFLKLKQKIVETIYSSIFLLVSKVYKFNQSISKLVELKDSIKYLTLSLIFLLIELLILL